jgi:antitoxin (DNA-binding transcriptional repressor) of toxin-antitoxin stability system
MNVSTAEAKNCLPQLIRAVQAGEEVIITRHGKPVAQLNAAPVEGGKVQWGSMKDRIKFNAGWDDPVDEDRFLAGDV